MTRFQGKVKILLTIFHILYLISWLAYSSIQILFDTEFFHYNLDKQMQEFQFIKELGSGSFGRVVKVRKHQAKHQFYAMKQIKMMQLSSKEKDNALNQVRLLASIDAPNIISYKSAFFEQFGSTLCIIMQFADGGDLAGLIKTKIEKKQKVHENFIWQVAYDILKGLKTLHANKIIHRDIKPANVFFVGGVAKIGDLNVSKVMDGNFCSTQTGTPYYTSPQIWSNHKYDGKCDIWSLGCLLYELAVLRPPFLAKDFPGLSRKVSIGYYDPISSSYSRKLARLIQKCLQIRASDRPTASQLLNSRVFESMQSDIQQGDIQLLDTIRCPKVLKNLHQKLKGCKSAKKIVTMKVLEDAQQSSIQKRPKSIKKIMSQKNILSPTPFIPISNKYIQYGKQNDKQNQNMNMPLQSPCGYVKLPRINSHKNIF